MKKVFSLLLAVMLVMSLAVPAAAAENEGILTFLRTGGNNAFYCTPGDQTATNLFGDGFKNVMPGDKVTGYVTVRGNFLSFNEDTLKVYMRAIPHNDNGNAPVHSGITDVEKMNAFLSQLNLRVYNESQNGVKVFDGKANALDGLSENVYLGSFRKDGAIRLRVELEVPIEMTSDYANEIGEVDWLFTVEAFDDPAYDNPKTGDYIMISVAVMVVSAAALIVLLAAKRRKRS